MSEQNFGHPVHYKIIPINKVNRFLFLFLRHCKYLMSSYTVIFTKIQVLCYYKGVIQPPETTFRRAIKATHFIKIPFQQSIGGNYIRTAQADISLFENVNISWFSYVGRYVYTFVL